MSSRNTFFVMIKPDAVRRGLIGEILSRFERKGFTPLKMEMVTPSKELISEHYMGHSTSSFFEGLVNFTVSGHVIAIVFEGDFRVARGIVGNTIPWESAPGTIRGDLACKMPENLIHCSSSIESARREVELWF